MIEIEYIVKDKHGMERLRTADKKAADAYDKALEIADRLAQLLRDDQVLPDLPDADIEELTIYLARNARNVERVLKGKELEPSPPPGKRDDHSEATAERPTGGADSNITELKRAP
ncbi:YebG family protein [Lamprobacter modestohalophilus]|uniref:YebG family protein n=1 Tax=Lamprobacter modestohalophilus TaxID=1064514 RepID=UPI002ADECBFF|nr:YebG family protein [Lamprobacter modestohalophilus]MEA1052911.1 YebG family protein [Lamprobacter modestohalophilus]